MSGSRGLPPLLSGTGCAVCLVAAGLALARCIPPRGVDLIVVSEYDTEVLVFERRAPDTAVFVGSVFPHSAIELVEALRAPEEVRGEYVIEFRDGRGRLLGVVRRDASRIPRDRVQREWTVKMGRGPWGEDEPPPPGSAAPPADHAEGSDAKR